MTAVDYDDPAAVSHAERAASLIGRPVTCRPNGPMGPVYRGTATAWGYQRGGVVVLVASGDDEFECWSWDVKDDPEIGAP